jgi:hypothetical protein
LKFITEIFDKQSPFYKQKVSEVPTIELTVESFRYQKATELSELSELIADLTVSISRLIAEHEEISGR